MGKMTKLINRLGLYTKEQYDYAGKSHIRLGFEIYNLKDKEGEYEAVDLNLPSERGSVTIYRTFTSMYEEFGKVRIPVKTWWYDDDDERDLALNMAEETLEKLEEDV